MAKSRHGKSREPVEPGAIIRGLVRLRRYRDKARVTFTIAVNDAFNDDEITSGGGVDYPQAMEWREASEAITRVFQDELGDLRNWLAWAAQMTGGLPRLAARLVTMEPLPDESLKDPIGAELRALQRLTTASGKERHTSASEDRLERMRGLNAELLRERKVILNVKGDWEVTSSKGGNKEIRVFHWWPVDDTLENISVLDAGGDDICPWAERNYADTIQCEVQLLRVYGLQIQCMEEEE